MADPIFIYSLNLDELETWLKNHKQPAFRAKQIWQWLYKHQVQSWDEMNNLPGSLRLVLDESFSLKPLEEVEVSSSSTGTRKILSRLYDNELIEEVLIPAEERRTVCVSSQVGCKFGCVFAQVVKMG